MWAFTGNSPTLCYKRIGIRRAMREERACSGILLTNEEVVYVSNIGLHCLSMLFPDAAPWGHARAITRDLIQRVKGTNENACNRLFHCFIECPSIQLPVV
jgi:hypothetical protein